VVDPADYPRLLEVGSCPFLQHFFVPVLLLQLCLACRMSLPPEPRHRPAGLSEQNAIPSPFLPFLQALGAGLSGEEAAAFRRRLAWKAFQHCATYDSTVAEWLWGQVGARRGVVSVG